MVDLDDIPLLGEVVTLFATFMDLVLNSGEFLFLVINVAVTNIGVLTEILRYLESLAQRVPFLPAGIFDDLLTAVLIALLVLRVATLGSRILEAKT